ncbi:uncharacterized protein LOC131432508 [Malaya genurostris]|uniref:uncharacterized protein LOC131432508 n=1 Tax=Malaya genurostris TaxID=325434 RepID=UPI0026F3C173|nr:uncharacterized protein LOC131432508 [Malaya genurostris]XP_058454813.1 uncharacterized protein LOC131432508 [Malaya genurostris]
MLRGILSKVSQTYQVQRCAVQTRYRISTALNITSTCTGKDLQPSGPIQSQTDSYLHILKNATDAKEVLEFMPALNKRDINRQAVTLAALKSLFELHKQGKTSIQRNEILNHSRFSELCKALKHESRSFMINDVTESLKILTYFGVHSNSEIMTVLLNLLRYQINDVTLDHIVFLDFILKKMERSPLIEALQLALPMLLQIQISYKMDHENIQQLVDLLGFITQHNVSNRCITNVLSALTLHGANLSSQQAADILISMTECINFEPVHLKLLDNVFEVLTKGLNQLSFKTVDFILKKMVEKNVDRYPMLYNDAFLKCCSQFPVDNDLGLMNALYLQKKLNKIAYLHVPLLEYIASHAHSLSIVPKAGIITIVAAFSNANYKPSNWNTIKSEIQQHSTISNASIPWIRYNLELLSLDIFNKQLIRQYLEPFILEKNMARNSVVDYLQLLELSQALQLLHPEYDGPLPDARYLEKATALLHEDIELPLLKPLEVIFGGEGSVLSQVTTGYGHVLHHVVVFDQNGIAIKHADYTEEKRARIEDLFGGGKQPVVVLCVPKSFYAININRLRGRFAMNIRTIETLGVPVVPISYQLWYNLPEAERIPFLEREIRTKLAQKNQ